MAELTTATKALTRQKISTFFLGAPHELIRFIEDLTQDVTTAIPVAINEGNDQLDSVQATADLAASIAQLASAMAGRAISMADMATAGPPATVQQTPEPADEIYSQMNALRERVTVLERAVANVKEGPTP